MNIINVFFKPANVYSQTKAQPSWGQSFIILSFVSIIIAFFTIPINTQITNNLMSTVGGTASKQELIQSTMDKVKYWSLLSEPINLTIRILIFSALAYIGSIIIKRGSNFKQVFALCTHAFVIIILSKIANLCMLYIKGIENIKTVFDMSAIGLNIFSDKSVNFLNVFLSGINIFEIWFIWILVSGISYILEIKKSKSAIIVISTWLIIQLFSTFSLLMSNAMYTHMH